MPQHFSGAKYPENKGNCIEKPLLTLRFELPLATKAILIIVGLVIGVWLSLVERQLWELNVAGSNPVAPTIF